MRARVVFVWFIGGDCFASAFRNFVGFIFVDIAKIECDVSSSVAGVGRG
jgi:hypothetical protein